MFDEIFESIQSELLTEEVKIQIAALFEANLNEAIAAKTQELEEKNAEDISLFKSQLTDKIEDYLDYVTRNVIKENSESLYEEIVVEKAKIIVESFEKMVKEFNIALSDESVNENFELESTKKQLNSVVNESLKKDKEIVELKKRIAINEALSSIEVETDKEKFLKLAENVEYSDSKTFNKKLNVIKESVVVKDNSLPEMSEMLNEEVVTPEENQEDQMSSYLKYFK